MPPPFTSYTQAAVLVKAADHPISNCCKQAFAQACAVYSPKSESMSEMAIYRQLSFMLNGIGTSRTLPPIVIPLLGSVFRRSLRRHALGEARGQNRHGLFELLFDLVPDLSPIAGLLSIRACILDSEHLAIRGDLGCTDPLVAMATLPLADKRAIFPLEEDRG